MDYIDIAKNVFDDEIRELLYVRDNLGEDFNKTLEALLNNTSKVVFMGIGKSGLVGMRAAASFSSVKIASFFLHPNDALHGGLGSIDKNDLIFFISKSGQNEEILSLLPHLKENKKISICANTQSALAKHSDIFLNCSITKEACPLDLVPTTSLNVVSCIIDALIVSIIKATNLTKKQFATTHPVGELTKNIK